MSSSVEDSSGADGVVSRGAPPIAQPEIALPTSPINPNPIQIVDLTPPTVQVLSPNGGEVFQAGAPILVQWQSSDDIGVIAHDVKFSRDGGATFTDVAVNLPGSANSFSFLPSGNTTQGLVRVVARDGAGNQSGDRSDGFFTIGTLADMIAPIVQVLSPNGGEVLQGNQQFLIQWLSSDNVGVAAHDVKFSRDGGASFIDVATNLSGSTQSFFWTVPAQGTSQGVIRVVARDAAGNQAGDRSDANFIIQAQPAGDTIPPTVQVLSPNGGEILQANQQFLIQWLSSDNVAVVAHDVKFSRDGGATFTDIATNLSGATKSFSWMVPLQATSQGVIRVVARDAAGNQAGDRSDANFIIQAQPAGDTTPPTVQVLSPNGGEVLQANQSFLIQWLSSDNVAVVAHDVKFSRDGGTTFTDIATNLSGATKSFSWSVPLQATSQGVIRVVARDAAGNQAGDRSDANFIIQAQPAGDTIPPTVQVLSPNGGEILQANQPFLIQWLSSDNVGVVAHDVKFSRDGGTTFTDITTNLSGATKSFSWSVPLQATIQGVIRVVARDAAGNQAGDRSDANFIIQAQPAGDTIPPTVQVLSPNGGEILQANQPFLIQWLSSDNVGVVAHDVKFSRDGGTTFVDIATNLAGSAQSFQWTVPAQTTMQGVIRVVARDAAVNQGGDRSDATFTIQTRDTIAPAVTVLKPNGGEVLRTGQPFLVEWRSSDNAGVAAHDVKFSADGGANFTDIATGLSGTDQSFPWTVPSQTTTQGLIRVVARDAAGNQAGDRSDAVFSIIPAGPKIISFSPDRDYKDQSVTIVGQGFKGVTGVLFGDRTAGFRTVSETEIAAGVPIFRTPSEGPIKVRIAVMTANGNAVSDMEFTVTPLPAPKIDRIEPASATEEKPVTIFGQNLLQISNPPSSVVFFNNRDAGIARYFEDSAMIETWVPIGAKSGPVTVTTPGGVATAQFIVETPPAPEVDLVDPPSGGTGTRVTITGKNFIGLTAVEGVNRGVFFRGAQGDVRALVLPTSTTTSLKFDVPQGAITGPITIVAAGGMVQTKEFSIQQGLFLMEAPSQGIQPQVLPCGTSIFAGSECGKNLFAIRNDGKRNDTCELSAAAFFFSDNSPAASDAFQFTFNPNPVKVDDCNKSGCAGKFFIAIRVKDNTPPGRYTIKVSGKSKDDQKQYDPYVLNLTVAPPQNGLNLNIVARNRVFNTNLEPVSGCNVELKQGTVAKARARTDSQGKAVLGGPALPDGGYRLLFVPLDTLQGEVGPATATDKPDVARIWRVLEAPVDLKGNVIVRSGSPDLTVNGSDLTARIQPVWMKSPNTRSGKRVGDPTLIVVHRTSQEASNMAPAESTFNSFLNPAEGATPHYVVDTDGQVVKLALESKVGNSAGCSNWKGAFDVDTFSVGIEQVNRINEPYPQRQVASTVALIGRIRNGFASSIPAEGVVGHSDIATTKIKGKPCPKTNIRLGRKLTDPGVEFPWTQVEAAGLGLRPKNINVAGIYGAFFVNHPNDSFRLNDNDANRVYGGKVRNDVNGNVIAELQTDLQAIGYYCPVTGVYNEATSYAVKVFNDHFFTGTRTRSPMFGAVDKMSAEIIKRVRPAGAFAPVFGDPMPSFLLDPILSGVTPSSGKEAV